ncbi:hypothetical protein GCM10010411_57290 [Actinomadura fulvescens]|uniref:Uncharacterized protein n=1 Tax=Actinomadura fulvescens TaxID=46160 RepID=A0ABP6CD20_9ACTN
MAGILSEEVSVYLYPEREVLGAEELDGLSGRRLVRAAERVHADHFTSHELYVEFLGPTVYCLATEGQEPSRTTPVGRPFQRGADKVCFPRTGVAMGRDAEDDGAGSEETRTNGGRR